MIQSPFRCVLGLLLGIVAFPSVAAEFWVAPEGDDRNPGTKEQPLASLAMAQRKARELRRLNHPSLEGGVRLILRGGVYRLDEPLLFRWEDSGTAAIPTIVSAASGERPMLSGGVVLEGWRKATEVAGLPATARVHVWVSEPVRFGGRVLEMRQLWSPRGKATRARHPNGPEMARLTGWDREREQAMFPVAVAAALRNPQRVEMLLQQQWEIAILRLKTLERVGENAQVTFQSPESRIEFEHPWPQPILPPNGGGAFYLVNALEFLDAPGEWWQDIATGRVYYWPRADEEMNRDKLVAPALETLLQVQGSRDRPVAHVRFEGIGFEHTTWLRPSEAGHVPLQAGMHLLDGYRISPPGTADWRSLDNQDWIGRMPAGVVVGEADGVRFERCRFEHHAASALDLRPGTRRSTIEGCVFRDIGGNGIQLGSFQEGGVETHVPYDPADPRDWCADVRIANNFLTDIANEDWGCVSILAGYVREVTIEHNEISNTSYTGISVGWGWTRTLTGMRNNRVRANLIHHLATRMCDTAGVYTLSAQPGTVIAENVVHSVIMSPYVDRPDHWFYYYTDEGSSFITVRDNWCPEERFLRNANGPGNVWENNGPMVSEKIKQAAGLEPAFHDLRE